MKWLSENTIYTLLALIVPIPFLFMNDVSGPIVEREVIFHSYKSIYRHVLVTGYENGSRRTWRLYSTQLNIALFDGEKYLIKEEK